MLINDGHLSQLWYEAICLAKETKSDNHQTSRYTTDILQPLDVSVFKSLKDHWGSILFKRVKISRKRLSKSEFLTVLASEDVRKKSFSETKYGILPFDQNMFPKKRFNVKLLQRYDAWVENGKPEITADQLESIITEG